MMRTSLFLPEALHQQLLITSQQEGKSFTELVRELLDRAVAVKRTEHMKTVYRGLKALDRIGDPSIIDASTTIDDVLYGDRGAWKGLSAE